MNRARSNPSGVGAALPHESAHLHVSGEAVYTDDIPTPEGTLHAAVGMSEHAHARLVGIDLTAVRAAPGVVDVLTAADIRGENNCGPVVHDDPILAADTVEYAGQSVFAVLGMSANAARRAARMAHIEYELLRPVLDAATAVRERSFITPTLTLARGDAGAALATAPHRLAGGFGIGGQDHFYLEGQIALAVPGEDDTMEVWSSTQHPSEIQFLVAACLGLAAKDVSVHCRRMGGAFGGKETQAALVACIAALGARKTGRAVKLRLDRDTDMLLTGKRHPYEVEWEAGFDDEGRVLAARFRLTSVCGRSADLSDAVNGRGMFHADNCYFIPDVEIVSQRCRTNHVSHTAFRGFGGPQGMMAAEDMIDGIARSLGKDPLEVRRVNFYDVDKRNVTPYGMTVDDNIIARIVDELSAKAQYAQRRSEIAVWNRTSGVLRRGIALTPVKFGIAFTTTHLNQAGALVHVYLDGTVQVNHGGTEMGQGLHTKVAQVVAQELSLPREHIRCTATDTGKVPNTSATAASAGSDLNGRAAQAAVRKIRGRLAAFAAQSYGVAAQSVLFDDGHVLVGGERIRFRDLVMAAHHERISLSATGFYKTPKISYDPKTMTGRPFFYFCYGAAVSEAVVDTLTGESRLLRVDILHDVGRSLNPAIDLGQVEGGFMQGAGWLTSEELVWDDNGILKTHAPSTYKIPTAYDWPEVFNVELLAWGENREKNLYRSKAVGEPPLMLAISVFQAIRDAIASLSKDGSAPRLDAPATPERILDACARCPR